VSLFTDLKNIYHLTIKSVHGANHAERMENFYSGQAEIYDDFVSDFSKDGNNSCPNSRRLPAASGLIWEQAPAGVWSTASLQSAT
jgi:hypothetical protein